MVDNNNSKVPVFKKSEEKKLEELFNMYSKQDTNFMRFYELIMLLSDKNIFTCNFGLKQLYEVFFEVMKVEIKQVEVQKEEKKVSKGKKKEVKQEVKEEKPVEDPNAPQLNLLSRVKFNYLMIQLSIKIYPGNENCHEELYKKLLQERTTINKDQQVEMPRQMVFDDNMKKMLQEDSIKILISYEKQLKQLFQIYQPENLEFRKTMLNWREISLQNKKISSFGFLKFLKEAEVIPQLMSVETFEDIMPKIVQSVNKQENQFYLSLQLVKIYDQDINKNKESRLENENIKDPQISFFEFCILLLKLAHETYPKDLASLKAKDFNIPLPKFFGEILQIQSDLPLDQLGEEVEKPQILKPNKASYKYMLQMEQQDLENGKTPFVLQEKNDEDLYEDPQKILAEYAIKNQFNTEIAKIDFQEVFKILDSTLQQLPPKFETQKQTEGKALEIKVIGDQVPKPVVEKGKGAKAAKGKAAKPDPSMREIRWAGYPTPAPKISSQHIQDYKDEKEFGKAIVSDFKKATLSEIEVMPVIIKEVLYPGDVEESVRTYIEAAFLSQNEHNYALALENFALAKKQWMKISQTGDISYQAQIFFEFSEGLVYESTGRDDLAFLKYWNCRSLGENLSFNYADRALAFIGLGSVLFSFEEYNLSTRCFLKAREIRERILGPDAIDTATVYNNLGCCMLLLDRNKEALAYLKLAHVINETELGQYHSRTATALRNVQKCNKRILNIIPEYQVMWRAYEEDKFAKKKKEKKAKKK